MIYPRPAESSAGRFRYTVFQLFCDSLSHGHIPATILLLFMVIRVMAVGEAFLSQLLTPLAVDEGEPCAAPAQEGHGFLGWLRAAVERIKLL